MSKLRMHLLAAAVVAGMMALPAIASASGEFAVPTNTYPATVSGKETVIFAKGSASNPCTGTPETALQNSSSTLSFDDELPCEWSPLKMNGCEFTLHPRTDSFDIGPPGCGPVSTSIFNCGIRIPSQTGLHATYESSATGVDVELNTGPTVAYTFPFNDLCHNGGAGKSYEDLEIYTLASAPWELTADSDEFGDVNLFASDTAQGVRVYNNAALQTEVAPAGLVGSFPNWAVILRAAAGGSIWVECPPGDELSGGTLAEVWEPAFGLTGTLENCRAEPFGGGVTVDMNSCKYQFRLYEPEPPVELACAIEGDKVEVNPPGCPITIPPQVLDGTIEYTNEGTGKAGTVTAKVHADNIRYEATKPGFICGLGGVYAVNENGVMDTKFKLDATYAG